jgi:hypothetical protein
MFLVDVRGFHCEAVIGKRDEVNILFRSHIYLQEENLVSYPRRGAVSSIWRDLRILLWEHSLLAKLKKPRT